MNIPKIFIIGSQRCGTTSFHNYLIQHENIFGPIEGIVGNKETHFFSFHSNQGLDRYERMFNPLKEEQDILIDSSPSYIFIPGTCKIIKDMLPYEPKFILLLRNPIDRAYSFYKLKKLRQNVGTFEEEIKYEIDLWKTKKPDYMKPDDIEYGEMESLKYSLLSRGRYVEQLQIWYHYFSPDRFFIIRSEDMFENPEMIFEECIEWIGLDATKNTIDYTPKFQVNGEHDIEDNTRSFLYDYFLPYNEKLYDLLGKDMHWN